ncbi:MAG: CpsD/CapB family tyrosine-protein kinase [Pelosinus sp.]|nr:CpsD/CapB family tyrosine-protein kinase [Pelosinus sp.]
MSEASRYIIKDREQSPLGEAFRALKGSILNMQEDGEYRTLLFTGIGDGKETALISANMAAILAYAGKKVVLVDADLRWSSIHNIFGFGLQIGGLVDVVNGKKKLMDVLRPSGIDNLRILTSGAQYPCNPVGLLSDEMIKTVLKELRETADYVIINSSSLRFLAHSVVSDACILASKVDGVAIVLESQKTRAPVAKKAINLLKGARAKIIGVVLNDVKDDTDFLYYTGEPVAENSQRLM